MDFLYPGFLYLSPLLALPILIHLLNRIRYRRLRWAAIDFLLVTERREVRRARLKQILLLMARTLLLAAALGALAQPLLRGGLAAFLGGSPRVAVLVDASASMSAADASGSAFARAKKLAQSTIEALPRRTRVMGGTVAVNYDCPFREPVQDRHAVASVVEAAKITGGQADMPRAISSAAESLARAGGGGTIWIVTDMQAGSWRATDAGAWQKVRQALKNADQPHIVITDLAPAVDSNLWIASLEVSPTVLVEGDAPKLAATVAYQGNGSALVRVALFCDGRQVDAQTVEFSQSGKADCVFYLPPLESGPHAGYLDVGPDALPADDRYYFLLETATYIPVLVVDGAPSPTAFEGAGDFVALGVRPAKSETTARSPFSVKTITTDQIASETLSDFAAVFLADVPKLDPDVAARLRDYVTEGGLLVVFPGAHTDVASWNKVEFLGVRLRPAVQVEEDKPLKVIWTSPTNPVTATMPTEGLDLLGMSRFFPLETDSGGEVLARIDVNKPLLVRLQVGKGKLYMFAVSGQDDFSNLPFTPVFLLTIHRMVLAHLVEAERPLARSAFAELRLSLPAGVRQMLTPDGRLLPLEYEAERPGEATFNRTEVPGIYHLVASNRNPDDLDSELPVAAVNVPAIESELERISPSAIRSLLPDYPVSFLRVQGGAQELSGSMTVGGSSLGFFLAALAMMLLLGEGLLAWSMGRVSRPSRQNSTGT